MPFQDPLTKRLHLVFLELLLLQSVRSSAPRSLSCLLWRLLQCSDTFRLLADCPRVAPVVFGPVMAITALLFLACLQIEFTRVPMHVVRPHIQLSRHLLRTVFVLYKQPMVSSPQFREKNSEMFLKKNSQRGAWSMPGAQTTTPSDHEESTNRSPVARPNSIVLAFFFNPGKGRCYLQFLLHLRSLHATNEQTNKASSPPVNVRSMSYRAHALSPQ